MPAREATPFSLELDRRVDEGALGTLYEKLPENQVRCYACAHRCLIKDGLRGICKVRYNRGGTLMVPRGYVGALQCDPIEKKPFFHAFPGTDALTFGMLGCDLHCSYCFTGDVRVATNLGMRRLVDLWDESSAEPNGDVQRRRPSPGLTATGHDGRQHEVRWVFRHDYQGALVRIRPSLLRLLEATPEHPILATERPGENEPHFVRAGSLTTRHFVCVPVAGVLDFFPVLGIGRRHYCGPVFNLETTGPHTYLANNTVVHNCQNWVTSQALRDPGALADPIDVTPRQLVDIAQRQGATAVATSYNEPLITSEWAVEVFKEARPRGFTTAYISNGNATREVLEYIRPWTDLYKIDLKSFRDKNYRSLGGKLENIVNGIRMVHAMGFWLEIVTLIIPGFNDSDEELDDIAQFLSGLSPSIPWHVTAFHKDYKMQDPDNTTAETLLRAARIGEAAGLQYVYAGNLPGRVGRY
ncbi:MAG: radical SAM protein, partial [Candidatus Dormibacteraeota bacterium]|nr:radical SAM protein [Candidatus Dormibacteraeota bacterium]